MWHRAKAAYDELVVVHASQIGYMENALRGLFFFSPSRFRESELTIELGYGALGLLGMYHDIVVLRHLRRAAGGQGGANEVRLSKADWLRVALTSLQHLELFAEVAAQHRLGAKGKWTTVAVVESLKALVRLGFLAAQGGRMIEHQKVPERAEILSEDNQHLFNAETLAKIRTQSNAVNGGGKQDDNSDVLLLQSLDDAYFTSTPHSSTAKNPGGKQRKPRETILRRNRPSPQPSPSSSLQESSPQEQAISKKAPVDRRLALLGELLYIFRPLVYLAAMYVWGLRSWRAWVASLAVDVGAWAASSTAYQGKASNPELARRTAQWCYYLVRSPFYEMLLANCVLRRIVNFLMRLPLVSSALGIARAYIEAYRERYFYISGSSA